MATRCVRVSFHPDLANYRDMPNRGDAARFLRVWVMMVVLEACLTASVKGRPQRDYDRGRAFGFLLDKSCSSQTGSDRRLPPLPQEGRLLSFAWNQAIASMHEPQTSHLHEQCLGWAI